MNEVSTTQYISMGCLVLYGVLNGWYLYLATKPSFVHHIFGMAVYVYSAMAGLVYLIVARGNKADMVDIAVKANMAVKAVKTVKTVKTNKAVLPALLTRTVVVKMCVLASTKFTTTLTLVDKLNFFKSIETACTLLLVVCYATLMQSMILRAATLQSKLF